MKTPETTEEQLRSWTPRRPSARLAQTLFEPEPAPRADRRVAGGLSLPWYRTLGASLAGCTVVLLTTLNFMQLSATHRFSAPFGPLSNHMASLAMATAPVNTWTAPILGWTNDGTVGSSMRPFGLLNTNSILP